MDVLRCVSVSTLVPTGLEQTWSCLTTLIPKLWHTEVLLAEEPVLLLHSIAGDFREGPQCWLTWTLAPCGDATRVSLVLSEEVDGSTPDLDGLLLHLLNQCVAFAAVE